MRKELEGISPEELEQAAQEAREARVRELDEHFKNDTLEQVFDFSKPVRAKVAKRAGSRASVGLRLAPGEMAIIEQAARARGMSFSEFLREAALAVAAGSIDETEKLRLLSEFRIHLQQLEADLDRAIAPS